MWRTIKARRVLYADYGRDVILCDRLHSGAVTLVADVEEIDGMAENDSRESASVERALEEIHAEPIAAKPAHALATLKTTTLAASSTRRASIATLRPSSATMTRLTSRFGNPAAAPTLHASRSARQETQAMAENIAFEPWEWRNFGAHLMLVTRHRGAKVVLAPNTYALDTRCAETGILRPLHQDDDVAKMIRLAPEAYALARAVVDAAQTEELSTHVAVSFEESDAARLFNMAEALLRVGPATAPTHIGTQET